ncbi:putative K domain-containing protein [Helianthus annuus]|nr:putative K domain-containing protein [Helianthus annuus]
MLGEKKEKLFLLLSVLYPFHKIGRVIGRGGASIKSVREASGVRVDVDDTRRDECIVTVQATEVIGEVGSVRDALVQIVLRLRDDVLKDRDSGHNPSSGNDSMFAGGSGIPVPLVLPSVSSLASLGYEHRAETRSGMGLLSSSSIYAMNDSGYGSLPSYSSKQLYGGLLFYSFQQMVSIENDGSRHKLMVS